MDRRTPLYDSIGIGYTNVRRPDPRIADRITAALGPATHVLNLGAGAGSYEPDDRTVVAVEPSVQMIGQRPPTASPLVVRGVAGDLPFPDRSFDGALALLTVHHWPDPGQGLRELRRVTAGPIVVFGFDHHAHTAQWLTEYLPSIVEFDRDVPSPSEVADELGGGRVEVVPVPADCIDGFCHAWWRRPEAYLDPRVRAGISVIARLPADEVRAGMERLAHDLATGGWQDRHGDLLDLDQIDAGYRLVVAPG